MGNSDFTCINDVRIICVQCIPPQKSFRKDDLCYKEAVRGDLFFFPSGIESCLKVTSSPRLKWRLPRTCLKDASKSDREL